ncbi:MAG: ABC transporter ATP-binding protein [Thermoguttaceae bacterium]
MSGPAVNMRLLDVLHGGCKILQIEQLAISRGEISVVFGPNGAGKSTLLKCVLGFVRPSSGEINVLGQSLWPRGGIALGELRRRVGYVPQMLAPQSEAPLTVREVVAVGRTGIAGLFRRLSPKDWEIVDVWLERLGLCALAGKAYAKLSGGEQRKTLIAKAMAQQPEMLLLDEPTANLDLFWREQIVETLEQLHIKAGLTIVLVCHEVEVIPRNVERLVVLRGGKIVANGRPEEILTGQLINDLYGPRLKLEHTGDRFAVTPGGGSVR